MYYAGVKKAAEIAISPAGDLLFVSMRLDGVTMGSVVSYRIDTNTGALTFIEQESSCGATPRQFTLSQDGKLLLVDNGRTGTTNRNPLPDLDSKQPFSRSARKSAFRQA